MFRPSFVARVVCNFYARLIVAVHLANLAFPATLFKPLVNLLMPFVRVQYSSRLSLCSWKHHKTLLTTLPRYEAAFIK